MAAASTTVRPLLLGPVRPVRVVAVTPRAVYLEAVHLAAVHLPAGSAQTGASPSPQFVAVLAPDAVRVPFGLVLDGVTCRLPVRVRVGDPGQVGGGLLRVGGLTVRPLRWWDPVVPTVQAVVGRLAVGLAAVVRDLPVDPPELLPTLDTLVGALQTAAAGAAAGPAAVAPAVAVRALVGRGPGLTPTGDDLLAGALAALAAVRPEPPARRLLVDAVRAEAHRTTPVSAALLAEAAVGRAVPQLVDVVRVLGRGPEARLGAAVAALAAVGHTSGTALAHGLVAGLLAATVPGRVAA